MLKVTFTLKNLRDYFYTSASGINALSDIERFKKLSCLASKMPDHVKMRVGSNSSIRDSVDLNMLINIRN